MTSSLRVRIPAPRSPGVKPRPKRFVDNALLNAIERSLNEQGLQSVEGGLVLCWENIWSLSRSPTQKQSESKASPTNGAEKRPKKKRKAKKVLSDEEDGRPAKCHRSTFTRLRGESHSPTGSQGSREGAVDLAVKASASDGDGVSNVAVQGALTPSPVTATRVGACDKEAAKGPVLSKLKIRFTAPSEKPGRRGKEVGRSQEETRPSPKAVSTGSGCKAAVKTASIGTQVVSEELVPTCNASTQAAVSLSEKEVQTLPQPMGPETLEEHLVRLKELLVGACAEIPAKPYDAVWSEGRTLKKLAESQSREAAEVTMETMVLYLHSALKFLEAAHTQEKRRDMQHRRHTMYKDTGDLLLHTAGHMRKYTKLKPFVKKCIRVLAERLAAIAYVRHNFFEWRNCKRSPNGTTSLSPVGSPGENGRTANSTDTLFKGLNLIQSTAQDLDDLRGGAKSAGGAARGAVELISTLGSNAGLGDMREIVVIAQHAIENLSRYDQGEAE